MRKHGLTNPKLQVLRAWAVKKVTPGITELSRARAHIDPEACYLAVGSSHPGRATATKGGGAHLLMGNVSWV